MSEQAQRKIEQWQDEERLALERLAQTEDGELFLMQLIASTGVFEDVQAGSAAEMAFAEGRRSIGLEILDMLEDARSNSAGRLLARMFGRAGQLMRLMFLRINNHRKELEVLKDDE